MKTLSIALALSFALTSAVVYADEAQKTENHAEKARHHKEEASKAKDNVEKNFHETMSAAHEKAAAEEASTDSMAVDSPTEPSAENAN